MTVTGKHTQLCAEWNAADLKIRSDMPALMFWKLSMYEMRFEHHNEYVILTIGKPPAHFLLGL